MGDCEIPSFSHHADVVARKQHLCCECLAPIDKGEKHFRVVGKWNGELSTYRQHFACMEACMVIRDHFNDGECIAFGQLHEWCCEYRREMRLNRLSTDQPTRRLRTLLAQIYRRERRNQSPAREAA